MRRRPRAEKERALVAEAGGKRLKLLVERGALVERVCSRQGHPECVGQVPEVARGLAQLDRPPARLRLLHGLAVAEVVHSLPD